jgi:aminomethyltransferase
VRRSAKIIPFGGWLMPVQYTSIIEEHQAVRKNVGIFDISHMGQLLIIGPTAAEWLNTMLTNNIDKLAVGQGQYTFLLHERGGIIDDLIVYRIEGQMFLLVVNAARTDEDFAWLNRHRAKDVDLKNRSAAFGGVAFQNRACWNYFARLWQDLDPPARNHIVDLPFDGTSVSVTHRLHRRRWCGSFLSSGRCGEILERCS